MEAEQQPLLQPDVEHVPEAEVSPPPANQDPESEYYVRAVVASNPGAVPNPYQTAPPTVYPIYAQPNTYIPNQTTLNIPNMTLHNQVPFQQQPCPGPGPGYPYGYGYGPSQQPYPSYGYAPPQPQPQPFGSGYQPGPQYQQQPPTSMASQPLNQDPTVIAARSGIATQVNVRDRSQGVFVLCDAFSVWRWVHELLLCTTCGNEVWEELPSCVRAILRIGRAIPGLFADFLFLVFMGALNAVSWAYFTTFTNETPDETALLSLTPLVAVKALLGIYAIPYFAIQLLMIWASRFVVLRGKRSDLCFVRVNTLGGFCNKVMEIKSDSYDVKQMLVGTPGLLMEIERRQRISSETIKIVFYTSTFVTSKLCLFRNTGFVLYYLIAAVVACLFDGVTAYYLIPSSFVWINCAMWLGAFVQWMCHGCNNCYDSFLS